MQLDMSVSESGARTLELGRERSLLGEAVVVQQLGVLVVLVVGLVEVENTDGAQQRRQVQHGAALHSSPAARRRHYRDNNLRVSQLTLFTSYLRTVYATKQCIDELNQRLIEDSRYPIPDLTTDNSSY